MEDGHSTRIAFSADSDVVMAEKEVTPPGISGGGANDVTTMLNVTYRTMAPKNLITLSEASFEAAYDPAFYDEIITMVNLNQTITVTFPDGGILLFRGWIDEFTPNRNVEGEQPTAEITIIPSNRDPVTGAESAPIFTPGP
jgi:hypothetical protein